MLLRMLHERDVRRTFCSPALWLGPHQAAEHAGVVSRNAFAASAVVRAIDANSAAAG